MKTKNQVETNPIMKTTRSDPQTFKTNMKTNIQNVALALTLTLAGAHYQAVADPVTTTALVYVANTSPPTPINGLGGINFQGLAGENAGVLWFANGEYILSYDDNLTGEVTCSIYGYQPNTQSLNGGPVELSFAMQPAQGQGQAQGPQGYSLQFEGSRSPAPAPATLYVGVTVSGNAGLALKSGTITWGDGQSSQMLLSFAVNTPGFSDYSHVYTSAGTYTVRCTTVDHHNIQESSSFQFVVTTGLGTPGALISAYDQTGPLLSPCLFACRSDGHLWENYWDQAADSGLGQWLWKDHGTPPGTSVTGTPSQLLNSPATGLSFFVLAGNGHIFERHWNPGNLHWGPGALSFWSWVDHGTPPGTTVATDAGALISADNQTALAPCPTPCFFVGGADGHLWENSLDQPTQQWLWQDHGTPPDGSHVATPGAVLNSVATGLKFFMSTRSGELFERYWDGTSWGWTAHGAPHWGVGSDPGVVFSWYQQLRTVDTIFGEWTFNDAFSPAIFVADGMGSLWENYWDQSSGWQWFNHGRPNGLLLYSPLAWYPNVTPGALFNSAEAGLKFMMNMVTNDGEVHLVERFFNQATYSWGWTDHGTCPGVAASAPSCALDSPETGIKYFLTGNDGHLWENWWNQTAGQWLWTDHGMP